MEIIELLREITHWEEVEGCPAPSYLYSHLHHLQEREEEFFSYLSLS